MKNKQQHHSIDFYQTTKGGASLQLKIALFMILLSLVLGLLSDALNLMNFIEYFQRNLLPHMFYMVFMLLPLLMPDKKAEDDPNRFTQRIVNDGKYIKISSMAGIDWIAKHEEITAINITQKRPFFLFPTTMPHLTISKTSKPNKYELNLGLHRFDEDQLKAMVARIEEIIEDNVHLF